MVPLSADLVETDGEGVPQEDYMKPLDGQDGRGTGGNGDFSIPTGEEGGADDGDGGGCSSTGRCGSGWLLLLGALLLLVVLTRRRLAAAAMSLLLVGSLAYADPSPNALAPLKLTEVRKLASGGDFEQPSLSPDGKSVAFSGEKMKRLLVVPLAGGEPREIARGDFAGYEPLWRSDGKAIFYRSPGQRSSDVPALAVTLAGDKAPPPSNATPGKWLTVCDDQVFLRTGRSVAQLSQPGDRHCCAQMGPKGMVSWLGLGTGLYVHDTVSGRTWSLGQGNHPTFSPDGSRVLFDRCTDDGDDILSCDLVIAELTREGAALRTLDTGVEKPTHPSFGPAGRTIVFSASGAIWAGELPAEKK